MSAADNLGNLFVALLAGIPLLIFVLFACCACLEASIQAARRSYKPHVPSRVRFADEAEAEETRRQRNPLLFGLTGGRSSNRGGPGQLEGSGLVAHSSYIQRYPNYRYSTVGLSTPPPALKSRTELGSGSLKSPVSPLSETQRLLEREYGVGIRRSTPTRGTPPKPGSPASYPTKGILITSSATSTPPPVRAVGGAASTSAATTPIVRQDTVSSTATDTQSQPFSEKSSPTLTVSNVFSYFDGSRRSSTSTPSYSLSPPPGSPPPPPPPQPPPLPPPTNFQYLQSCGPHVDSDEQRRYSTPSSPTIYAYKYEQRPQTQSNYSSMSYLPEVRTYLNFMEESMSTRFRQRSNSFSGRPTRLSLHRRSPRARVQPYHLPSPRTPSPLFSFDLSHVEDEASKLSLSTPSSFETTFLTPPGSTDQGSFKSPESCTPDWLLSASEADVNLAPFSRVITAAAIEGDEGVNYKQPLSRSCSIRTATM